jgi:hypothetical protein
VLGWYAPTTEYGVCTSNMSLRTQQYERGTGSRTRNACPAQGQNPATAAPKPSTTSLSLTPAQYACCCMFQVANQGTRWLESCSARWPERSIQVMMSIQNWQQRAEKLLLCSVLWLALRLHDDTFFTKMSGRTLNQGLLPGYLHARSCKPGTSCSYHGPIPHNLRAPGKRHRG